MAEIAETKYGLDGKVTFEQSDGGIKVVDLANLGGAAGAGVTNISFTRDASTVKVESDTGNDATIPEATNTLAGIMSASQAAKLAAQADTPVLSVAGKTGVVALTGADVGLGSVNNTTDAAKPISTLTQLALNQKQNTLTAPGDVPGLTTALSGKQPSLTTYTEVPGLTVALNAKQATLTGVADVPNLQASLDAKQGRLAAGTNKLLAAPSALGGAPTQVTIGANLAFDGTTLSSTAPGGGSTTYAGLTDAASVNLPTVNSPLQTALGNKAEATQALVVTSGMTLDRTPATGGPTGHYNRQLGCAGGTLTVSGTGAVALDTVVILNTHASTNLVVTFPGPVVLTGLPGKFVEAIFDGTVWKDVSVQAGTTYTDSQALAASVLAGALGTDANKAPTHSAVTNAIAAIPGASALAPVTLVAGDNGIVLSKSAHGGTIANPRFIYYGGASEINISVNLADSWVAGDSITLCQTGDFRVALTGTIIASLGIGIETVKFTTVTIIKKADGAWMVLNPKMYTNGTANGTNYLWHHQASAGALAFRFGTNQSQDVIMGRGWVYNQCTASGSGTTVQQNVAMVAGNTLGAAAGGGYGLLSSASLRAEITNPPTTSIPTSAVELKILPDYRTAAFFTNEVTVGRKAALDAVNSNGFDIGSTSGNAYTGLWSRWDTNGAFTTFKGFANAAETRNAGTSSFTIADNLSYVILAGSGTVTVTFPALPFNGQELTLTNETAYTSISLDGNGKTIIASGMNTSAGSYGKWRYRAANTTWHRIG